jgi:hypothetical protein
MNYITFRERFHDYACMSTEQVLAAFPDFDRGNYSTWLGKGYIKRRDVEHLLFHRERAEIVTRFPAFVDSL